MRAVFPRTDPEYYNVVSTPIDLLKIQHKLKSDDYEDIDLLTADIDLMVGNAKSYYAVSALMIILLFIYEGLLPKIDCLTTC